MTMQDRYIIVVKTMLGQGMPMTLKLIGACLLFSLLIGIVFGTIRSLKIPVVDQILGLYAVVCRGIPTIIVLLFFYATLVRGTQFWISVLSISLVEGAYMMEIVKGGFLSVDKGQWEAAKALRVRLWRPPSVVWMFCAVRSCCFPSTPIRWRSMRTFW